MERFRGHRLKFSGAAPTTTVGAGRRAFFAQDASVSHTEQSDAELVVRMAQGDPGALAQLYERHAARLLGLACAMLGDRAEAEDLLHDVFLEAWRRSHDYAANRGSVRAWLTTRTRSRSLDRIKSTSRRHKLTNNDSSKELALQPSLLEHRQLKQMLQKLPEAQAQVVVLAYFEDLTSVEIGARLGVPVGTVKSRMRAALSALRNALEGPPDA